MSTPSVEASGGSAGTISISTDPEALLRDVRGEAAEG